jgi:hypothetical protein
MTKHESNHFLAGVFCAMQQLVITHDQPTFAKEIAEEVGMTREWALEESKRTGFEVRKMNKFIREELR